MANVDLTLAASGDETPASIELRALTDANSGAVVPLTPAVPSSPPTNFTLTGGQFVFLFPDTGAALYAFTFRLHWADGTFQDESSTRRGLVPAGNHYSSRSAVEAAAGIVNVSVIADLQNGGDATYVATRIEAALSESDSIIDARFAQQNQAVPTTGAYQKRLATIGAYYALVYLYRPRGIADKNLKGYLLVWQSAADNELDAIAWALNRDALCAGAAPQLAYHDPRVGQTARASLGIPLW